MREKKINDGNWKYRRKQKKTERRKSIMWVARCLPVTIATCGATLSSCWHHTCWSKMFSVCLCLCENQLNNCRCIKEKLRWGSQRQLHAFHHLRLRVCVCVCTALLVHWETMTSAVIQDDGSLKQHFSCTKCVCTHVHTHTHTHGIRGGRAGKRKTIFRLKAH